LYNLQLLNQLPPCPAKSGWPWVEQVDAAIYAGETDWPKISVITPSFNQGAFIEETIRSILLQNYPNLEYIIIDGGSTDETTTIIKKYDQWINYHVSEPDDGQANAIQKGLDKCSGIIFNWINSDDLLAKDALYHIGITYIKNSANAKVIAGGCNHFTNDSSHPNPAYVKDLTFDGMIGEYSWFQQPSQWLVLKNIKALAINQQLHYAFDWDMILNLNLEPADIIYLHVILSHFRLHPHSKTSLFDERFKQEKLLIVRSYVQKVKSLQKKIILQKYLFRLESYLTVHGFMASRKSTGILSLITLGLGKPKLFFNRFYLGQLSKLLSKKKHGPPHRS
jgi:glycosyltransferase involved in cell wall biosynthesis